MQQWMLPLKSQDPTEEESRCGVRDASACSPLIIYLADLKTIEARKTSPEMNYEPTAITQSSALTTTAHKPPADDETRSSPLHRPYLTWGCAMTTPLRDHPVLFDVTAHVRCGREVQRALLVAKLGRRDVVPDELGYEVDAVVPARACGQYGCCPRPRLP